MEIFSSMTPPFVVNGWWGSNKVTPSPKDINVELGKKETPIVSLGDLYIAIHQCFLVIVSAVFIHPTPFVVAIARVFYGNHNSQLQLDLSQCRDVLSWFSYALQHKDFDHFMLNLVTMYIYGTIAQFSLGRIGVRVPFIRQALCIIFVQASSVFGGAIGFGFERRIRYVSRLVGASASVYGTVAIQVGFLIRNRKSWREHRFRMFFHANILTTALVSTVCTDIYMSSRGNNTTSIGSHIGGFVLGMLAHGASMPGVMEDGLDTFYRVASSIGLLGCILGGIINMVRLCN